MVVLMSRAGPDAQVWGSWGKEEERRVKTREGRRKLMFPPLSHRPIV